MEMVQEGCVPVAALDMVNARLAALRTTYINLLHRNSLSSYNFPPHPPSSNASTGAAAPMLDSDTFLVEEQKRQIQEQERRIQEMKGRRSRMRMQRAKHYHQQQVPSATDVSKARREATASAAELEARCRDIRSVLAMDKQTAATTRQHRGYDVHSMSCLSTKPSANENVASSSSSSSQGSATVTGKRSRSLGERPKFDELNSSSNNDGECDKTKEQLREEYLARRRAEKLLAKQRNAQETYELMRKIQGAILAGDI